MIVCKMFIVAILSCKHKKTTSYDLSAFFIQADRLGISSRVSVHIIKVGNTAPCISSHLQVCISVGLMIWSASHWWYTRLRIDFLPQEHTVATPSPAKFVLLRMIRKINYLLTKQLIFQINSAIILSPDYKRRD